MNITELISRLDQATTSIPLGTLQDLLDELELHPEDIQEHLGFSDDMYQRNLVRRTSNYEALLLCFKAGQRTPIHDHAGSACGVKVIQGCGLETIFKTTSDGWLFATGSCELPASGVVGSNDMDIHQLSNLQSDGLPLVTLHIYSPPLGEVGNYQIENNTKTLVTAATRQNTEVDHGLPNPHSN